MDRESTELLMIHNNVATLLDIVKNLDAVQDFALYLPYYFLHSITLAATSTGRLSGVLLHRARIESMKGLCFLSADICRRASIATGDLAWKCQGLIIGL